MKEKQNRWNEFVIAILVAFSVTGFTACDQAPPANPNSQGVSNPGSSSSANASATPATVLTSTPSVPVATSPTVEAKIVAGQPASPTGTPASTGAIALPGPTPIPMGGKENAYEVTLLDAPKMKLATLLKRRKVIVVNFWATWCGPCRREIPDLVALQNSYKGNKDVEIYGLSVEDPAQMREQVKEFGKQFQVNYKLGFAPVPMFMMFNGARPGGPIPQTFVFGKNGQLLQHIPGLRPAFREYLQQTIDIALKS